MAADQRRLTDSYEKLVESNQRISLVEADMVTVKDSHKKLWEKFDEHVKEQNKITWHALYDIIKLAVAALAGVVLAKYGVHLL